MIYLKHFENFSEDYYKVPHSIGSDDDILEYQQLVEKKFTGLGLDIDVFKKEKAGNIYKYIEVIISMNLTAHPFSLLSLFIGYLNPSNKWTDRDMCYLKLKTNKNIYGKIKDGKERILSFRLIFSRANNIGNLGISSSEDPEKCYLFNPLSVKEAYNTTIREFLKLVNSCSDIVSGKGAGFSSLFDLNEQKKVNGIKHFINGYLKNNMSGYDRKNILNALNRLSGNSQFYRAMEYQKKINPEIFNLLNISNDKMQKGKEMDDIGFYD